MGDCFKTIKETNEGFYEEKFSKFIAKNYYIETEEEVSKILEEARKEYKDARHIVYAYKIGNVFKYSDDGEPQGTGGMPILRIINGNELNNILIICVRYFGGILLGTGPLARAYMQASKDLIEKSEIVKYEKAKSITFKVEYKDFEHVKSIIERNNGVITNNIFLEKVEVTFKIVLNMIENIKKELKDVDLSINFYNEEECYLPANK